MEEKEEQKNPSPWDIDIDVPPNKEYELICFKEKEFNEKIDELIRFAENLDTKNHSASSEYILKELKKLRDGEL